MPQPKAAGNNVNGDIRIEPQQALIDGLVDVVGGDEPALPFGAKRPIKSDVWPHFTRFLDRGGFMKTKCKYYRKILGGDTSNGTSQLRTHKN